MMLAVVAAAASPAQSLASGPTYERMAPLGQYLNADRQGEIDLARSAAPPAIALHATVLVLSLV